MFLFKKKKLFFLLLLFTVILTLFFKIFFSTTKEQNYFVHEGQGTSDIAAKLKNSGVINSAFVFKVYSKIRSLMFGCKIVHFGEYSINYGESYESLLDKFCNGKTILKTLTVQEGLETREVMELLNNNKDLTGEKILFSYEGVLLPETYSFKSGTKREIILNKMIQELIDFLTVEWTMREKNNVIKTPKDAIILASIVEKEAKTDEERPIIASVYINRLKLKMKLDADPTSIYEITKGKYKLTKPLTKKDIAIVGDYNTYRKKGLPIAPICNPGKKSILAVLHPKNTRYLYFVANKNLSGHIFAENYKDHLKNIKKVKSKK
jgi:UPF0755 protein